MLHTSSHFVFWGFFLYFTSAADNTIVTIQQGKLKGLQLKSRSGKSFFAFLDIPYVDKPERFQPPSFLPPKPWKGVRAATIQRKPCIQVDILTKQSDGQEDCLTLNVYTRTPRPRANLTVLVFIHGGGYRMGSGHLYGPRYIMEEDVVLVTINYRLGVFGFLSTGDTVVQGNMGLKDQVAALKWVQRNIKAFGGNPDQVTLFGQSAGAMSIALHVTSPMSKGLFSRAIMQSGGALNPFSVLKNPKYHAKEFAEQVNCTTKISSQRFLKCLMAKTPEELLLPTLAKWHINPICPFAPVVEQLLPNQSEADVFLSRPPFEILSEGSFNKVPIITGINEDEGMYFHSFPILREKQLEDEMNTDWYRIAPLVLVYYDGENVTQRELNGISDSIRKFYFQDRLISLSTWTELTDMFSDRHFVHGTRATAMLIAKHKVPTYNYMFAYKGHFGILETIGSEKGLGVTHADDLLYFFDGMGPDLRPGPDLKMSRRLIKLWVSFARTGKPVATWGKEKNWEPISILEAASKRRLKWYVLNEDTSILKDPFSAKMSFWNDLMRKHPVASFPRTAKQESRKVGGKKQQ